MGIKAWATRKLAMRWLRGKVKDWRKGGAMKKVLAYLDGWKLVIGVLILTVASVWDHYHNGSAGSVVAAVLAIFGWLPSGIDFSQAVPALVILIGLGGKVWKAQAQLRAGAKVSEVGSPEGAVKLAMSNGTVWQMIDDSQAGQGK